MAPTPPSNFTAPGHTTRTQINEHRKRKASSRITDENFVGAESNAFTKRLKQSANTTRTASVKHKKRQLSVKDVEDEDSASVNSSLTNPNAILEAADRADYSASSLAVSVLDDDSDDDDSEDEPKVVDKPVETAGAQRGESIKMY
jgi:hypothetical protein